MSANLITNPKPCLYLLLMARTHEIESFSLT